MKIRDLHFVKVLYAALLFLLLSAPSWTNANPVSERLAREVGAKFISVNTAMRVASEDLQLVTTYRTANDEAAFHIFNTPNGFVIVSADDCATPILGYSEEGQFDMQNIPIQLQDYLQDFVEQIQYGIENHMEAKETIVREWELVRTTGRLTENRDGEMVEPLITAMWDQGCYYNAMCPEDEDGPCGHCVPGSVATAMAQIMHYWGYPTQGTGSHSYTPFSHPEYGVQYANFGETVYDWANMPNQLIPTSTQAEVDAVSTLMYHCGVSVNTDYSFYDSNGAVTAYVADALKTYFNYSTDAQIRLREYYSDSTWINMLKSDLNQSRPILYSGRGHRGRRAFVCDGYDVNDRFHFNWGVGGYANGYYFISALLDYSYDNVAIFNIYPNAGISHQVTASASPSDAGTVIGAGLYDIGSICTLTATANADYTFMYWTENDEVVSTHAEYSFCVRKDRDLVAHFSMPFQVEAVLDPVEGGIVSGVGEYAYGSTCTLTAMPDEGYDFICWRRTNGSVVSTASTYTFTVTEATTLIAVFAVSGGEQIAFADLNVKAICVAYWDSNGDGELSFAEAAAVTNIGGMFSNNAEITAFDELQYFTGLTSIGSSAFYGCSKLISIEIPNHVTIIGDSAFYGCSSLTGSLIIPNSVTTIDRLAFAYCRGFTGSLTIGNSVTSIGEGAFYGCIGFTGSLTIGNSVTSVGEGAFYYCIGFTGSLTIGNSVTIIGDYAFYNCYGFTGSLTIGNSVTIIGAYAFSYCDGFTGNLTIPNSVTTIGNCAFYNCIGFTGSLAIGNSVTIIGYFAFYGCSGFTGNLTIPNSVTTIRDVAFYGCSGFTGNLTIPNSVTTIGYFAFYGCSGFTGNLTIPNSVTTIEDYAFYDCSGFTGNLTIPNSVTTIGDYAFYGCSGFTGNLTIPNSVTSIEQGTFSFCSGFTGNLTIPNSVTTIGDAAFSFCSGFTGNLTIPNSVTTIEDYAFYGCNFTSVISFAETPPMLLGNNTFWSGHSTTPVYVPCGFDEAYSSLSWGGFVNFMGLCAGEITTIANPAEGGTVSGAGYYEGGATCTLVATANTGYTFISWTKDGIVVSNTETYSFIIAGDATYVANFLEESAITFADANVKALCVAYWDTNGDGELSYAEAAAVTSLGEVFRNQSSITSFDELQFFISLTSIGDRAFYNCTGLTSIQIPNSVTSIGYRAFFICSLTSMTVLAVNPPTLDDGVFEWVDLEIFVYVPCESVEAYEAANWGGFNNFIGMCAGEITVIANPAEGGTVTGGGYYEGGAACTLTATTNTGYTFINWTKDGVEVSNSETYSFFVGGDASFVANFEQGLIIGSGTATNEYLPSYSYYCYTLSQQIYTADEVGSDGIINSIAFFNAGATKTRSYDVYMVSTEKTVFENSNDWIAVTENDLVFSGQVTMSADTWTVFQFDTPFLYDGVSNIALVVDDNTGSWTSFPNMACRVLNAQGNQAIQVYDDYSNYDPHYPSGYTGTLFSVKNQIKLGIMPLTGGQTCTLSQGWNWWSTYIEQDGIDGLTMLEESLGANGHQIKSQTDFVTNFGSMWMGMLTSINNEETYMLDNYSACQVVLTGAPASPTDHPITVSSGWNWIGYPCANTMSVAEAFSGYTPSNGDQVKSQSDYAMYYGGMWIGQLQNIVPGTGLMYKSNSPTTNTLVYPDGGRSAEMTISPRATHWTNDIHAYPNNMTVMAVVELDGQELSSDSYELAAFDASGECRGSVRLMYVEPIDRYMAFLTVSGKDAAVLSFRLYDTETGTEYYDANENLNFTTNAIVGDADDLYTIHFRGTTGMDELASSVKVYPNPVNRGEQFSIGMVDEMMPPVLVEIVNALGVETLRATSVQMPATLTAPATAGVYTLRITVEGKGTIVRKLVVK